VRMVVVVVMMVGVVCWFLHKTKYEFDEWVGMVVMMVGVVDDDDVIVLAPI
jgi:hypothetical protein